MKRTTRGSNAVRNVLTFDLEHWHTATLIRDEVSDPADHIERSTRIVLDLLEAHNVRATFFVVGQVAEEYPQLVQDVATAGHEIASHGQTHSPLSELTPAEFERELAASREAIQAAAGVEPDGFRAPNFSLTRETEWAFSTLASSRYRYDSSLFPMKTPMYGVRTPQRRPYRVDTAEPFHGGTDRGADLVEVPLAVTQTTPSLPIAGGFYARTLPTRLLQYGIRRLNSRGIPANVYFHPWEFNPDVKTGELPLLNRTISFYGIEHCERTLSTLLSAFEFEPIGLALKRRGELAPNRDRNRSGGPSNLAEDQA